MPNSVALLRGINVGGRNKVAMADLRDVLTSLGHTDVATYIQSGNAVFTTPDMDRKALARALEQAIAERLAVRPSVIVLSKAELSQVIASSPFPGEANPKFLHAVFWTGTWGPDELAAVAAAQQRASERGSPDEAQVAGNTLYLRTPDGLGRSVLAELLSRNKATGAATMRNWATVLKLQALLDA